MNKYNSSNYKTLNQFRTNKSKPKEIQSNNIFLNTNLNRNINTARNKSKSKHTQIKTKFLFTDPNMKKTPSAYLKNKKKVDSLYLDMNFSDKKLISLIETLNLKPIFVRKSQLDQFANENHQGIIIDVGDFEYCDLDDIICDNGTILILDHLEDPHNFGAI